MLQRPYRYRIPCSLRKHGVAAERCWPQKPLQGLPCSPQRLMIADLAPIDHDPHRLAVTVYHHEVEGRREGVILEGLRQRVRVVSLVEPHRQHAAIWADGTKDAR